MVFRRYFRFPRYFQLVAFIRMSSRLDLPLFIGRRLSLSFSYPWSPSPLCLLPLVLSYSGGFLALRLVCTLFTIHRILLIANFLDGGKGRAVSFLIEEISGLDHAIDFHASLVLVFLSLFPTISSFVASIGIANNLNWIFRVSIKTLQFNRISIPLLIRH